MDVPKLVTKATYGDDDSDDVTHQTSIVAHVELLNAFAALAALFRSHQDLPYTSKQSTLCKQTQVAARRHATHHEVLNHATTPTVYVISQLCNWKKTNSCRSNDLLCIQFRYFLAEVNVAKAPFVFTDSALLISLHPQKSERRTHRQTKEFEHFMSFQHIPNLIICSQQNI